MVFFGLLTGLALILLVMVYFMPSKTMMYRRRLTDLYVAGRIRQLAEKDNIDLEKEYKLFRTSYKKIVAENKPLDHTIELEMQDRLINEEEGKLKSDKKEK
jgi:hypothetical protein